MEARELCVQVVLSAEEEQKFGAMSRFVQIQMQTQRTQTSTAPDIYFNTL